MPRLLGPLPSTLSVFAVLALLALAPFAAAGTASMVPFGGPGESGGSCPSPSPWDSNSSLYPQICDLSAFQALLDRWGDSNFSWGMTSSPSWDVVWLTFSWVAACDNSTLASEYGQCAHQEYWGANITSGAISGPTSREGPETCACGEVPARPASPWPPAIVEVGSGAAAAIATLGVVVWLRRRRPAAPTTAALPNPPPQS
jgi:hypothetical protein